MPRRNRNVQKRNRERAASWDHKGTQRAQLRVDEALDIGAQQLGSGLNRQEIPAKPSFLPSKT